MNNDLLAYIANARKKGTSDDTIKNTMVAAGWDPALVEAGLKADPDLPPPPPPPSTTPMQSSAPIAVVHNLTARGLEYVIMFIAMGVSATALGFLLHDMADALFNTREYSWYGEIVPFATASLLVALPIFIFLFLRLKKAELSDPHLRQDPSRKRAVQLTLVVTFLIGLFHLIGYIYSLINAGSGYTDSYRTGVDDPQAQLAVNFLHTLITLAIAGGIFVYYWLDSHRKDAE